MDDQVELLRRLTREVAATPPAIPLAHRLSLALIEILGLDGATMSVGFEAQTRTTLCATDELAELIEDLQDVLREGPGLDAHRRGVAISVTADELGERWPMLGEALAGHGRIGQVLAVPMRPDSEVLGVLTLYGRSGLGRGHDLEKVQFLANAIGVAVLGGFQRAESAEEVWSQRDLVHQATGMVVAQLRIGPPDALALLRAHAFAHDASLGDIAAEVVGRQLDFSSGSNADGVGDRIDHESDEDDGN